MMTFYFAGRPGEPIIAPMIHVREPIKRRALSAWERAALGAVGGAILGYLVGGDDAVARFARLGAQAGLADPREVVPGCRGGGWSR